MGDRLMLRGPDDGDAWCDESNRMALAHRRLAVVDLSPAGHQPMRSASGRYVVAYNGEIYNHAELREELKGAGSAPPWRGHSDTETLLACLEAWGLEKTLRRTVGMFAVALWDTVARSLYLARDRFGEKPLYYGWCGGAFVFGSELKALTAAPGFANRVCRDAVQRFLNLAYVPAPLSIYDGIFKLEPGCYLRIEGPPPPRAPEQPLFAPARYGSVLVERWWSLHDLVTGAGTLGVTNEADALAELEHVLSRAVKLQSQADVPLGAFLSGGVDSSAIVALMQKQSQRPVQTFTVAFEDSAFDESPHAKAVARHLGTEHSELFVTAADALAVIPQLPDMYDEPFADASQIPTHLVCRAARQKVTVALSGDAGDELFGGYNRYFWGPRVWKRIAPLPFHLRQALARGLRAATPAGWDRVLSRAHVARPGEKLHKLADAMHGARTVDDLYLNLVSQCTTADRLMLGGSPTARSLPAVPVQSMDDPRARMMYRDAITYLPDDILCKVDRAAMAVSLETRVPFLDHRVAELAWRLPMDMKIRGNTGKWALRQVLYRHVPRDLIERPKAGFAIPVGRWLAGPLRSWAEPLLDPARIRREGFLDGAHVRQLWSEHLSGRYDRTTAIWSVLMFQAWLDRHQAHPPRGHA